MKPRFPAGFVSLSRPFQFFGGGRKYPACLQETLWNLPRYFSKPLNRPFGSFRPRGFAFDTSLAMKQHPLHWDKVASSLERQSRTTIRFYLLAFVVRLCPPFHEGPQLAPDFNVERV